MGRWVLAGTERGRRVHRDPDRSGRHAARMMRAVNKEPADPQGRKGQLVLRQPVTRRQPFLAGLGESSARGVGSERELSLELGVQQRRLPIGLDLPLLGRDLERRYGVCIIVEQRKHGIRRIRAAHLDEQAPDGMQRKCPPYPDPLPHPSLPRKRGRVRVGESGERVRGEGRRSAKHHARSTKASMTFLSPATSKWIASLLSSTAVIVP